MNQETQKLAISAEFVDSIYYARAVNNIPTVYKVGISSKVPIRDAAVRLEIIAVNGPIVSQEIAQVGELDANGIVIEKPKLNFDANAMFNIQEREPAKLKVSVFTGETLVDSNSWEIDVLPANFWQSRPELFENALALTAFSQPNHPSVRKVLDLAVDVLKQRNQDPSLSGYQATSHVDEIVDAIYTAIQSLNLTYSNPPATWVELPGQKIRTVDEVLLERVGTCLDTTMLMSSCLEAVGLYPLIFLVPGHAFIGYWSGDLLARTNEPILTPGPIDYVDAYSNFIDSGLVQLLETTTLAGDTPFREAQRIAKVTLDDPSLGVYGPNRSVSLVISTLHCRLKDFPIRPLPARTITQTGQVEIHEYVPPRIDLDALKEKFAERDAVGGKTVSIAVPPMVRKWLDSLLDLSLRNPLISFANKRSALRLLVPKSALGLLEDMLQSQKSFLMSPFLVQEEIKLDNFKGEVAAHPELEQLLNSRLMDTQGVIHADVRDVEAFIARMRKMASEAKSILQETGSNGLYLALGSLTWEFQSSQIESPLILVPVTLTPKNRGKAFFLSIEESGVTPNFSLVEKLKIEHKVNLEGLANLQTDKFGVDIDATIDYVRDQLIKAGIKDFKVNATATLGFFNFSSYRLWKDLLDNWQRFEQNPLVKHLIYTPGEAFIQNEEINTRDLDELIAELPIGADSSQAKAVAEALEGKTFVLQGPPGTGKSQTITNLLAKSLDEGKRILFVAEKKDALDVVKSRIDAAGLGAFSLDLHDKNSTAKSVKQQLANVIDVVVDADKIGFENAIQDYNAALGPLKNYRNQLHQPGSFGESLYSAMSTYVSTPGEKYLEIPSGFVSSTQPEIYHKLLEATKSLAMLGASSGTAQQNPWSYANLWKKLGSEEIKEIGDKANELAVASADVSKDISVSELVRKCSTWGQLQGLAAACSIELSSSLVAALSNVDAATHLASADNHLKKIENLGRSFSFDYSRSNKIDFEALENEYLLAKGANFIFRGLKTGSVAKKLSSLLGVKKSVSKNSIESDLPTLKELRKEAEGFVSDLLRIASSTSYVSLNPLAKSDLKILLELVRKLVSLNSLLVSPPKGFENLSDSLSRLGLEARSKITALVQAFEAICAAGGSSEVSIDRWGGVSLGQRILSGPEEMTRDSRQFGSSQLIRWNDLMVAADGFKSESIENCLEPVFTAEVPFDTITNAFIKGFYKSLYEVLTFEKGLNTFDGSSINNNIRKLIDAHERLRQRLPRILGKELLDRRGFDGSMRVGAVGDLVLSIKQSRSNISLRQLLEKHWQVISKMTPCVLASPDSAVRFLSASFEPFDLVVFDEASQIRVANSIGALGRARAALVVGDSQQMPPTSVAIAKTFVDEEEAAEEEEYFGEPESILDQCVNSRVPEIMLTWHYRSEDESLIAFSNLEYYKGKLSTFPTPNIGGENRRVSLLNVGGQFIRSTKEGGQGKRAKGGLRTNPVEAEAIVKEVISRLEDPMTKDDSIGIVTLNEQQKVLIENLMANSTNKLLQEALEKGVGGEEILVKALEKVQGSERDVVLLSVAFSPKQEDPTNLPLQFGPIIYQGGHRRLNVAITRARKEVKVFCSFEPRMLEEKKPASRGLQDLAKFMTMASSRSSDAFDKLKKKEEKFDYHRASVAQALRDAGMTVIEEVGLSEFKVDLAISDPKTPDKATVGILLDGHRWNSRHTVSDRDALPNAILKEKMGWLAIERIWLPNWLRDPDGEINRIKDSFNAAKTLSPRAKAKKQTESASVEPIFRQREEGSSEATINPLSALLESVPFWKEAQSTIVADQEYLNYLGDSRIRDEVRRQVKFLTETEGPVSKERLGRFVAACFGFNRVVSSRIEAINGIGYPGHKRDREGFLYPEGIEPESFELWFKVHPDSARSVKEISIREIVNAMRSICNVAHGVTPEQLIKEASKVFGVQKVSKETSERFEKAIREGLESGILILEGEYLKSAD